MKVNRITKDDAALPGPRSRKRPRAPDVPESLDDRKARDERADDEEWGETETGGGEPREGPAPRGSIEEGLREVHDPRVFVRRRVR